jgi:peroxiredoxin Q/BCP
VNVTRASRKTDVSIAIRADLTPRLSRDSRDVLVFAQRLNDSSTNGELIIMLKEGDTAPDFTSRDAQGHEVKLSSLRGQNVVLYFYPKDDTPGCTKEACSFRDSNSVYEREGVKVLGVSLDDEASHQRFAEKYNLPFPLIADTDHSVADAYGVYGEQTWGDRKFMGVARKTFLIDKEGKIKKVFDKVNVEQHADEVLAAFRA